MRVRAERVDDTRRRIAEAAMRLHTSVGPTGASIAAIAEEAGVTRLTVYRHFRDQEEIFEACMAHWAALHPRPDPRTWAGIPDLARRARVALTELYGWYADVADELAPIHRDLAVVPERARRAIHEGWDHMAAAIAGAEGTTGDRAHQVVATARLLVRPETYRSLVHDRRLTPEEAVDLAVRLVLAAAE